MNQKSGLFRFGLVCAVAIGVTALSGAWLLRATIPESVAKKGNGGDGGSGGSSDPGGATETDPLDRTTKIRNSRLREAKQRLADPANAYLAAWDQMDAINQSYRVQLDVYYEMVRIRSQQAGRDGALGIQRPPVQIPPVPTAQFFAQRPTLEQARRNYMTAKAQFDEQATQIREQFLQQFEGFHSGGQEVPPERKTPFDGQLLNADLHASNQDDILEKYQDAIQSNWGETRFEIIRKALEALRGS